jgi:peptidoglycan/LPS O-acetylase OafA/YrhL
VVGALGVFFLAFFLIATGRTASAASARWVVLGTLTYPLYLIHQNIGFTLFNLLNARVNAHVLMWGVTALMLLTAYLVTRIERLVARPMKDALSRLLLPKPAPPVAAPPVAAPADSRAGSLGIDG